MWTFHCHHLRYWHAIWYMDLSWHNTEEEVLVLSRLTYFYRRYCLLLKKSFHAFSLPSYETLTWHLVRVYEFVVTKITQFWASSRLAGWLLLDIGWFILLLDANESIWKKVVVGSITWGLQIFPFWIFGSFPVRDGSAKPIKMKSSMTFIQSNICIKIDMRLLTMAILKHSQKRIKIQISVIYGHA